MKAILKLTLAVLLATVPVLASAQTSKLPQRNEIVSVETEVAGFSDSVEVFDAPKDGEHHYYLCVGHLGIGNDTVQILFDPAHELFIPLGDNISDALESLKELQALFKEPKGSSIEKDGCLAFGFPREEKMETVKISYQTGLLTKILKFTVEREDYQRSTYLAKSDLGSLVSGVKIHKALHPKE